MTRRSHRESDYEDEEEDDREFEEDEEFFKPGRAIHRATDDHGLSEKVLYACEAPEKYKTWLVIWGTLTCNPCLVSEAERVRSETYVFVYENKMELSRPLVLCCYTLDRVQVLYFDRDEFKEMTKAGQCTPPLTHCSFCPTLFDRYGEGLILHGGDCCSGNQSCVANSWRSICLCHPSKLIYPLENAEELKEVLTVARERAMEKMEKKHHANPIHRTKTYEKIRSKHSHHFYGKEELAPAAQNMSRT